MFERIFASTLRLYPSRFRNLYDEEARLLLRDRFRDETGVLRRFRLCLDLVIDITAGLPQTYWTQPIQVAAVSISQHRTGIPSFQVLRNERRRPGPFLVGATVAL